MNVLSQALGEKWRELLFMTCMIGFKRISSEGWVCGQLASYGDGKTGW